jgi:hypothetical protein
MISVSKVLEKCDALHALVVVLYNTLGPVCLLEHIITLISTAKRLAPSEGILHTEIASETMLSTSDCLHSLDQGASRLGLPLE